MILKAFSNKQFVYKINYHTAQRTGKSLPMENKISNMVRNYFTKTPNSVYFIYFQNLLLMQENSHT